MLENIPAPTPKEDISVLVIDNQGLVHEVIGSALHEIGIREVTSAFNAFHAKRLCDAKEFDFVLIAFNVSQDKDGFHLFEELKHLGHIKDTTTVIFLSAETSPELVNCIVELQPDDFWVKPLQRTLVESRLTYLIQARQKLHKMRYCMQNGDFAAAMYFAERHLKNNDLQEYHPRIKRVIGDCLFQLKDFEAAEIYYRDLLQAMDHAWVHLGLVKTLLKRDALQDTLAAVENLLVRSDTKFLTFDLLAQFYIEKEQYNEAYEQMKEASRLAPRNIERNKRLWALARLNHDNVGQLSAVQNMAKFAKNSIHESPQLTLNVIRSILDLATNLQGDESEKYVTKAEAELNDFVQVKGVQNFFNDQVDILRARLLCLKQKKTEAAALMERHVVSIDGLSIEDSLDKMKAFHELGMREQCARVIDDLQKQIQGDAFASQVVNAYLNQESIERKEIHFTAKELKHMATVNYRENRLLPAFNNLKQAMTLSPHDKQLALSLLKVSAQLKCLSMLSEQQVEVALRAVDMLAAHSLSIAQAKKRDQYIEAIGLKSSNSNYDGIIREVVSKN
tara:strand:+ start:343 stop:2028 length:1686 start_codon:yes stop_codon:yes gene_type:complete